MTGVRSWLKYILSGVLVLNFLSCSHEVLQILTAESNIRAGIATFHFNFTNNSLSSHLSSAKRAFEPDVIQSLQSGAQNAATGVVSAIPGAVSQVQSVASTLNTAIPGSIEALLPRKCSLGTKEFCIDDKLPCNILPLNFSALISTNSFRLPDVDDIGSLDRALKHLTATNLQTCLLIGLFLMFVLIVASICSMLLPSVYIPSFLALKMVKSGVLLVLGLICSIFFVVPVVIVGIVNSKTAQLPPWLKVEHGEVGKLIAFGLSSVVVAMVTSAIASFVL